MATEKWRRGLAWLMIIAVLAPILFLLLAFGVLKLHRMHQNANYAAAAFGGSTEITRVVGSKRTHGIFTVFGCTYAVVAISDQQANALGSQGPQSLKIANTTFAKRWPKTWQPTPLPMAPKEACREGGPAIPCCLIELTNADRASILTGLSGQSGWYSQDTERVAFVLPDQRLLGVIRYGD